MKKSQKSSHHPASVDELTAQNVRTIVKLEEAANAGRSGSDRLADFITRFCGSMKFVWVHAVLFAVWIIISVLMGSASFDPYPFNFLTLTVSLEAIFLSTFILISENRQARIDERRSRLDLQVNLLAEQEDTKMLELLTRIAQKLGIPETDPSVAALKQSTRPEKLVKQIEASSRAVKDEHKS